MPDETVVTTEEETPVGDPAPVVTPTVSTAPKPSDAQARISSLQSQLDKLRNETQAAKNERQQAILERAETQRQTQTQIAELQARLDEATGATQAGLTREQNLTGENAALKGELAKLRVLVAHPEAMPFADLIPATTDEAVLDRAIATIQKAHTTTLETARQQVVANTVPAAAPAHVQTKTMSAAAINNYLSEGRRISPAEFEKRLAEVAAMQPPTTS